ncbi:hypothetical protein CLFE_012260 [Clostridium felsineum DSM 794]|nr:hypothetical protein CLFE_012260 [Clostridium felsineum DSM 794]
MKLESMRKNYHKHVDRKLISKNISKESKQWLVDGEQYFGGKR